MSRILSIVMSIIAIIALIISLGTEMRYQRFKNEVEYRLNRVANKVNGEIGKMDAKLESVLDYFKPGGIVEKYIVSKNILEKHLDELERIVTLLDENERAGYLMIYVIGSREVWIAFRDSKDQKYIYQGMMKPGLNPYKFYFFKKPNVLTKYTKIIPYNAVFKAGDPDRVFFLIKEPGQNRLKKCPASKLKNIAEDLNLYIPTIRGK